MNRDEAAAFALSAADTMAARLHHIPALYQATSSFSPTLAATEGWTFGVA